MNWKVVTGILCSYGFFKEFKPIEPFLTPYLVQDKNFTNAELYGSVWPVWSYSYLAALVPVFLLTDVVRYKPVILLESLAFIATWCLLLWGTSVGAMQAMQATYGWATATEIAYYAYIYSAVSAAYYQRATSLVRAAVQGGKAVSYGLAQALVSAHVRGGFLTLNYVSLASMLLILCIAIALPSLPWRDSGAGEELAKKREEAQRPPPKHGDFVAWRLRSLWSDFRSAYSDGFLVKWSVWWAVASCGFYQVGNYVQALWEPLQEAGQADLNGAVEAANTVLGTLACLSFQFLGVEWERWGEAVLGLGTAADAALLLALALTDHIAVAYGAYIVYRLLFQLVITIAQFNIAKRLRPDSLGLVFGFNTALALLLQTALTLAVADKRGLHLAIRTQFLVYSAYHAVVAAVFLIMGVRTLCCVSGHDQLEEQPSTEAETDPPVYKASKSTQTRRRNH